MVRTFGQAQDTVEFFWLAPAIAHYDCHVRQKTILYHLLYLSLLPAFALSTMA